MWPLVSTAFKALLFIEGTSLESNGDIYQGVRVHFRYRTNLIYDGSINVLPKKRNEFYQTPLINDLSMELETVKGY